MNRTAIVYIAERCNQHCVFCLEIDSTWKPLPETSTTEVAALLGKLRRQGAEHITFMGGETFFRKDLGDILAAAKREGFTRVGVTTNGTVLSKPGFLRHLVDCGLDFIEFSLHGHTPELANQIAGTDFTFKRQAQALSEVNELGLFTIVNTVICRENKEHVVDIARYLTTNFPRIPARFKFKFVSMMGRAASHTDERMLRYAEVDALPPGDYLEEHGVSFWYDNFPLCRLGRHAAHSLELAGMAADARYFDYDHKGGADYVDTAYQLSGRCWPERCDPCTLRPICCGIEHQYLIQQGAGELNARGDDPLPILTRTLVDLGKPPFAVTLDPATAPERLEALRGDPRPRSLNQPPHEPPPTSTDTAPASIAPSTSTDAAPAVDDNIVRLRLERKEEGLVVELQLEMSQPGRAAYAKVGPFSLSYLADDDGVYARPGVPQLLAQAKQTLKRCAPAATLQAAGAAIAQAVEAMGWEPTASAAAPPTTRPAPTAAEPSSPALGDANRSCLSGL